MDRKLFFFTQSYPFDGASEITFINPELKITAAHFGETTIFPSTLTGQKQHSPKDEYTLITDYAEYIRQNSGSSKIKLVLSALFSRAFYREFIASYDKLLSPKRAFRLVSEWHRIKIRLNWFRKNLTNSIDQNSVFYTYWFSTDTYALALFLKGKGTRLITRAHGIDLYAERNDGYFPFRKSLLAHIDEVMPISHFGCDYLKYRYAKYSDRMGFSRLGVYNEDLATSVPSEDGQLRLVSCSSIIPLKRVGLIYESLKAFREHSARLPVIWTHFGGGPLFEEMLEKCQSAPGLKVQLMGNQANRAIFEHYNAQPTDLFIHLSTTEGIPVSFMEAQSFGIPILSTKVGGIPEIVEHNENGLLITANPTVQEVVKAIEGFVSLGSKERQSMAQAAKHSWRTKYSAQKNFEEFTQRYLLEQ